SAFGNVLVGEVNHEVERARVYNLEVDEFHTYFVGYSQIWVHNKGNVPEIMRFMKELETKNIRESEFISPVGWGERNANPNTQ
ncbi:MAG: HINT domain-containing protein, partial [Betaproteobacteria bacterium]|nr:HINT domain-containing protein [Betaproteobacteria bacterium]